MPIRPSFRDVALLAVDGTTNIFIEAERRFGPVGRRMSRQEQDDLNNIRTMLSELLAELFRDNQNQPSPHGASNGPR